MSGLGATFLSILMIAAFALAAGGAHLLSSASDRDKGTLMLVAAAVALGNVLVWTICQASRRSRVQRHGQQAWAQAFAGNGSADRAARIEPEVEIVVHRLHQLGPSRCSKKWFALRDRLVLDGDVALGAQLVDQLLGRERGHHLVALALDDDARGGAGGEEA